MRAAAVALPLYLFYNHTNSAQFVQNPPLLDPEFDVAKSLSLVRCRILVDGEKGVAGEFHCDPDSP